MGHAPGHPQQDCPPCKIIIDGGRYAGSARWLSEVADADGNWPLARAARYLATVVAANEAAITRAIRERVFDPERIDQAHAWSELQCHRAQAIERFIIDSHAPNVLEINFGLLYMWATEDRLHATNLVGGEYHGAWEVNGTEGITKKP